MPDDHRYQYHYDPQSGSSSRGNGDLASWVPILIFLFCFPPLGVILLALKLMGVTGKKRTYGSRHPYDIQRGAAQGNTQAGPQAAQERRYYRQAQAAPAGRKQRSKKHTRRPDRDPGKALTIGGAVMAAIFGLGALSSFLDALSWGGLLYSLEDIFLPLALCGGGLCMTWYGVTKSRRAKRYRNYLALIGRRESISVSALAEAAGLSERRVREDLQDMLDEGVFPTGYLDLGEDRLVLSDEGIQDHQPEPESQPEEPPKGMEREEAVLSEIRALNDAIEDEEMSRKIDRIGEITGKIFAYLREKPDKEGQLRSFLSYYLPTTLKILGSYAQMEAQGIEGENISAAKERIEGMMDKVVDGFEKQLDRLFQDDAMDITTDVEVLERMLDKDGLGGTGMTLGG